MCVVRNIFSKGGFDIDWWNMLQNWTQKHFDSELNHNYWSKVITTLRGFHWKRVTLQCRTNQGKLQLILWLFLEVSNLLWQLWFEHIVEGRRCLQHNHKHNSHQILPQRILLIQSNKHCRHLKGFSPEWMRRCLFRLPSVVQEYLHCEHGKGFSGCRL